MEQGNSLPDIVDDNLARITTRQMLRKFLTQLGEFGTIYIVVKGFE
jgi:hypothetical protein